MKSLPKSIFLIIALALLLPACAPEGFTEEPAGFFSGIWHGLIIYISAFAKLFGFEVGIHAVHNTGWPYWLGFILGLSIAIGGGSRATRSRK